MSCYKQFFQNLFGFLKRALCRRFCSHLIVIFSVSNKSTFGADLDGHWELVREQRKGAGLLVVALFGKYTIGWKVLKNFAASYQGHNNYFKVLNIIGITFPHIDCTCNERKLVVRTVLSLTASSCSNLL